VPISGMTSEDVRAVREDHNIPPTQCAVLTGFGISPGGFTFTDTVAGGRSVRLLTGGCSVRATRSRLRRSPARSGISVTAFPARSVLVVLSLLGRNARGASRSCASTACPSTPNSAARASLYESRLSRPDWARVIHALGTVAPSVTRQRVRAMRVPRGAGRENLRVVVHERRTGEPVRRGAGA
jgi:hypothetical protein